MAKKNRSVVPSLSKADLEAASKNANVSLSTGTGFITTEEFRESMPEGVIVKSMSPLMKPVNFPTDKVLVGVFTKIFETNPAKGKKGEGIEIVPEGAPVGIALPAVATLRQGLEISGVGTAATSPFLGRTVAIKMLPERLQSKKGQAAWHFVVAIYPKKVN